jgi:uncharacterized membrane protein
MTQVIIQTIEENNPQSVKELVDIVHFKLNKPKREVFALVIKLKGEGAISLSQNSAQNYDFRRYLWYLSTVSIAATATILVFVVPLDAYPWIYARNFFGLLFIFFIPGYAFARVALLQKMSKTQLTSLDIIELIGLIVGLSIVLVSLLGLMLYYSPFKLDLGAVVVSLFVITFVLSTTALLKEQQINDTYLINRQNQR